VKNEMSIFKKVVLIFTCILIVFCLGFWAASFYYGKTTGDLRERVAEINRQYSEASEAERSAKESARDALLRLGEAENTANIVARGFSKLAETNSRLTIRVGELEDTIETISVGLGNITNSITESGGLLQESLQLLLDISKRYGKDY
jgi:chromosome segregation ATPase